MSCIFYTPPIRFTGKIKTLNTKKILLILFQTVLRPLPFCHYFCLLSQQKYRQNNYVVSLILPSRSTAGSPLMGLFKPPNIPFLSNKFDSPSSPFQKQQIQNTKQKKSLIRPFALSPIRPFYSVTPPQTSQSPYSLLYPKPSIYTSPDSILKVRIWKNLSGFLLSHLL